MERRALRNAPTLQYPRAVTRNHNAVTRTARTYIHAKSRAKTYYYAYDARLSGGPNFPPTYPAETYSEHTGCGRPIPITLGRWLCPRSCRPIHYLSANLSTSAETRGVARERENLNQRPWRFHVESPHSTREDGVCRTRRLAGPAHHVCESTYNAVLYT